MIWESHFWKDDLLDKAAQLRKYKSQRRWPEASLAKLEQLLMLGFYGVRKLHEAGKLSTATMKEEVALITYPWTGKDVTCLNWHNLDKLYDFNSRADETRDFLFVCHQFVHSFVYSAVFGIFGGLDSILFASDRQRHTALLHVSVEQIAHLFDLVGKDYPSTATYTRNPKTGNFDVVSA